ncbi:Gfo/Idh/MocA family protein [Phaeocystidibacter luteus]|uniref:Gfo/Idh/MocA family oxidoreductase n=1 Tax=Phaeocystidibacter luteus TaxID=911197 RepID=A0A6N6RKB6_9FLAO|nr:Gfo/Idh/MocA family oxidoreductase [Phaeocystidibacter luteus]KAB2814368.1 Gfo/Idh/MocA family oxidoreductase [Phaeocystidibacter luteus]
MSKSVVNFLVCGVGRIGQRHARIIQGTENANLVATVDVNPDSRIEGVPHFESLAEAFEAVGNIDVVSIATPNGLHAKQAIEAINLGAHTIVEKPIALNTHEAEELTHTALSKNKLVFGVMQNRYSPPSQWLKEIVSSGVLGEIYMVSINCFWNRDDRYYKSDNWHGTKELDGGTLFTQFSHFVDIMYWLFGDIKNITSRFSNYNHSHSIDFEDSGIVQFDFVKGGKGSLEYSTSVWDANLESSLTIIAEKGSVKVAGQYMNEVVHCHIEDYEMPELAPSNPPNDYGPYKGSAANHGYVFENVIDTLAGNTSITTNVLEGMKVVDIIERIYNSGDR